MNILGLDESFKTMSWPRTVAAVTLFDSLFQVLQIVVDFSILSRHPGRG